MRKKKSPTCTENFSSYLNEFCSRSTIHALQYVGEGGRFLLEKLIWLVYILLVACVCVYLIQKAYTKWVTQPVIVSISTQETPIWKISFPAVTICPEIKIDPMILNFSEIIVKRSQERLADNEQELLSALGLVCTGVRSNGFLIEDKYRFVNSPYDNLKKVSLHRRFKNYLQLLEWLGQGIPKDELLNSRTYTSEGLCYSFNMLPPAAILQKNEPVMEVDLMDSSFGKHSVNNKDHSNLFTNSSKHIENIYPRRTYLTGIDGGFRASAFVNDSDLDYLCRPLQGFKVVVHNSNELPNMDRSFQVPLNQIVSLAIKPRIVTTSHELKSYSYQDRKCYYPNEKKLAFYNKYSQQNCLNECLSNCTLRKCGCIAFYMVGITNTSPICGPASKKCIQQSKVGCLSNVDVFNEFKEESPSADVPGCGCLPSCDSVEYDIEISQIPINWERSLKALSEIGVRVEKSDWNKLHISFLNVYFKEIQFLSFERHELYGYVDFFASTGGLLGLFIGISVTSLVEIVYFLTIRLGCNIKMYGRRVWSGDKELLEASKNAN